ncbi:MAG: ABC transporter permease [Candidatus Dormibacteraeota bacterium]|nr:ABC transporter permease [Candidatus Dormibacteraeota bacterium]
MIGALKGEWRKTRKRPGVWVLCGILLAALVLLEYVIGWLYLTYAPAGGNFPAGTHAADFKVNVYPENFIKNSLSGGGTIGGAIALILGVLSMGSEYGWGTLKSTFIQRPSRLTTWAAKLVVLAGLLAILVVLFYVLAAASSLLLASLDGVSSTWPPLGEIARAVGATWLVFLMWASLGMLLSVLFRQSALAIGIGLVYLLLIEAIFGGIFGGSDAFRAVERPLPGANAAALLASFGRVVIRGVRDQSPAPVAGAIQAAVVVLLYIVGFSIVGGFLLRRQDVS